MEYGLTEKGFAAKPFAVILEEEREAWKAAFGYDVDTSADTPEGAYIGNQVIKLTQLWEKMEALWAAGDPDSADGVYLDRLVSLVNVERESAKSTRVYTALWGDEGTGVLKGHLARIPSAGQFALQDTVHIGREKLLGFLLKIVAVETGPYTFTLDGKQIAYTAVDGDTEESIQAGLFAMIEGIIPEEYEAANGGTDGMEIRSHIGIVPFSLVCNDPKIEIVSLGAYGVYNAVIPGPEFVEIGALNEIVTNVNGLDHIVNYATGITGKEVESDTELRIEKNSRQKMASGNERAIENAIRKLPGVLYCRVYSNRSREEKDGRPPNSFEAIVTGGVEHEIAETIFKKGPGGIQPFGNTTVQVTDTEGFEWDIGFSRPENRYVWIKIAYEKNPEEPFPLNGEEMIKDRIDEWGIKNQGVGVDLFFQKLNTPIYGVPGIGWADYLVAVTDDLNPPAQGEYAAGNVGINERQIAVIDKTRISIEEIADSGL